MAAPLLDEHGEVTFTLVSFHAHPDDEALLTAGTLARVIAEGHRVVLVVATAGEAGLAASEVRAGLGQRRTAELVAAARVLGVARVEWLGYGDSGLDGDGVGAAAQPFAHAGVEEAALRLAAILRRERADVLTSYDSSGGYGHPDHVAVHHVGARAAELAGTPVVLEATVDRDLLRRAIRLARLVYRFPPEFDARQFDTAYAARSALTHRVDVRRYAPAKRAAMAAHASQASADSGDRTLAAFLRLPRPVFRRVFGHEWFIERGRPPGGPLLDDVFASVRARP